MNPQDIQTIVLEVIRRLQADGPGAISSADFNTDVPPKEPTLSLAAMGGTSGLPVTFAKTKYTPADPPPRSDSQPCPVNDGVLICADRLLTLAKIEAQLDGLRRIIVRKNTVITPALKEELSRRSIAIERDGARPGTQSHFALGVLRFDADRAPALHGLGLAADMHVKSLPVLVNQVSSQLAAGQRHVVVLTKQTSVVLCLLNRSAAVRAAVVRSVDEVKAAARSIAANVLVVDPQSLGRVQIAALLRAFENEGARSLTGELASLLE